MPTPDFVLELRSRIGQQMLWLMGANAIVLRDNEVLLVRRSDTGQWAPISGIVDPGEHPAETVVREALEETGVVIEVERMLWTAVTDEVTYANGDRCRYLDHGFRTRWISGEAVVGDEESSEVAWFPLDELPSPRQPRLDAMLQIVRDDPRDVVFGL